MYDTQGHAYGKGVSPAARRPVSRHPSGWEMNLGEEESIMPNRQADNAPPDDPDPPWAGTWAGTSSPGQNFARPGTWAGTWAVTEFRQARRECFES